MRKTSAVLCLLWVWAGFAAAQPKPGQVDLVKVPTAQPHYQPEYIFDLPADPGAWTQQKPGLHAAFGSTDELYLRSEAPAFEQNGQVWEATGWRGERLNAQVLVWSPDTLEQVRFRVEDLKNASGHAIPKGRIRLNMVRYVLSNFPYRAKNFSCEVTNDTACLLPDRFETFERFDLPGRTTRPVWISIDIPATAEPGYYRGAIQVSSLKDRTTLPVKIHVQPITLPPPRDWRFRLDLWQNPWVVAGYFQVEPWSAEHKILLRKHLKLYAEAGGKYVTTYAVHSPWSDNSYRLEETMIEWIKTADGSWKFDYSIFDQYVELAREAGVEGAITIYTPVPWGHRFRYLDETSGNHVYEEWPPASEKFKTFWTLFLDDLKGHLQKKGWFEKTYLGINENPLEHTMAAAKLIKQHSKDWKITYAGNWHPELSSLLDDYSVIITSEPGTNELRERTAKGFTTTYYVCCNPPQPNNFVFSAPIEGRYISWYAAAYGYQGFLRWAYDAWPADPMRDARHTLWPAGDCFLVYPGGHSSIRFEKLREGIVDYEKIRVLRKLASESSQGNARDRMKEFEAHLRGFMGDRNHAKQDYDVAKMTEAVQKGRAMIETLSNALGK